MSPIGARVQIALVALLLGCAGHVNELAPEHHGAPGVERFLLCAPNAVIALPGEISHGADLLSGQLEAYLAYHEREVLSIGLFETKRVWGRAIEKAKESGSIEETPRHFAAELAKSHGFDAIVMPSILVHQVRVISNHGRWDGVKRRMRKVNAPSLRGLPTSSTEARIVDGQISGKFPATSVHLLVYSSDGKPVFEGRGGLELLNEVDLSEAVRRRRVYYPIRSDLFSAGVLREAIAIAFDPYLPSPLED